MEPRISLAAGVSGPLSVQTGAGAAGGATGGATGAAEPSLASMAATGAGVSERASPEQPPSVPEITKASESCAVRRASAPLEPCFSSGRRLFSAPHC